MSKEKWNLNNRATIYKTIFTNFGKHSSWGKQDYPAGKRTEYENVLKNLAVQLTQETGQTFTWTAVRQQVRWAITNQKNIPDSAHARTYVLNKAMALEIGFVSYNTLCAITQFNYKTLTPKPKAIKQLS